MVNPSEVSQVMNPPATVTTGDKQLDFWVAAAETSRQGHQKDLDNMLPILKKDPQEFIHKANMINLKREQEYSAYFASAASELEHRRGIAAREYANRVQAQKPLGATDELIQMRQKQLSELLAGQTTESSISRLEKALEEDPISRYALRDPAFGSFLAERQKIPAATWYQLIGRTTDILEDRLRDTAFSLSSLPKLEGALKGARERHEASLSTMHNEIKKKIAAAREEPFRRQQQEEDQRHATYKDVKDLLARYPVHRF